MGEVYHAADTRLAREVAIKLLPPSLAADPQRLGRFRREARLLAQIDHPNIAAIYGIEEIDRLCFLVLEFVPGLTLVKRLAAGGLEWQEALEIARQVAEALEAAHEKGIVHRDLKPANIKITPEGKVKVLDFGLAKTIGDSAASGLPSSSPDGSIDSTQAGVILGTVSYMSPEQARGKPVDRRADIWSFGCVLYESLTGNRAFAGDNVTDVLTSVVHKEPDWTGLPAKIPPRVRALLVHCLEKDPHRRLHDIGDVRLEIEEILAQPTAEAPVWATPGLVTRRRALAWLATGVLLTALAASFGTWIALRQRPNAPPAAFRFTVLPPSGTRLASSYEPAVALSPDGKVLVFAASRAGSSQLYRQTVGQLEAVPIPGTEGATGPFFSPDGRWIAFTAGGHLNKIPATGGVPLPICDQQLPRGASWGPNDTILFTPSTDQPLYTVSAEGGTSRPVTTLDLKNGERSHRFPEYLPGGKAAIFTVTRSGTYDEGEIAVVSLEEGKHRIIQRISGTNPHYLTTGHIVYGHRGWLFAIAFDAEKLEVRGAPFQLLEGVVTNSANGSVQAAVAPDGTLAYAPGSSITPEFTLTWVNRDGQAQPASEVIRSYLTPPAIAPDGNRVAVSILAPNRDVWILDLKRGLPIRLTFDPGYDQGPIWTPPDGKRVTFWSARGGRYYIFWKLADRSAPEEPLLSDTEPLAPGSWSPDGRTLVFVKRGSNTGYDLWTLSPQAGTTPQPLLQSPYDERSPAVSPDGHWIAFVSNEGGRLEVYVRPFPGPGGNRQVSTDGGSEPRWAPNMREIYYRSAKGVMAVAVSTTLGFTSDKPRLLFEDRYEPGPLGGWAIDPDGHRFLMFKAVESGPAQINVVLHWFEELKSRVEIR
jgi:Tol biopolymer transport system component